MMQSSQSPQSTQVSRDSAGFKAAVQILANWGCDSGQMADILGMGRSNFFRLKKDPGKAKLSVDQLDRISYLLNIHQALRLMFDNPENIYGFMGMRNHNPYFNGTAPLELITRGHLADLYEVSKRIDALRGGHW